MANQPINLSSSDVIECPLIKFAMRRVSLCLSCKHYAGLSQASVNGEPIVTGKSDDYQVVCKKPITRRIHTIIEE